MGLFSGNTKQMPLADREQYGIATSDMATNEQARPVPVFYGKRRLGVTFIGERFNVYFDKDDGKKSGGVKTYYAGWKAMVCMGPVDVLHAIYMDRRKVWEGPITRDTTKDKLVAIRVIAGGKDYPSNTTIALTNTTAKARPVIRSGVIVDVILEDQNVTVNPASPPVASAVGSGGSGASFQVVVDSETYTNITIDGITDALRFHWGTNECDYDLTLVKLSPDQNKNPDLVAEGNPSEEHPAYNGQCYMVCDVQLLGESRTVVPNIEVVVGRYPIQAWQTIGTSNSVYDCEPVSVIVDLLQNKRYGLGIADERLDVDGLNSVSGALSGNLGISPLIDGVDSFRGLLTKSLEYFDGYATSTNDGKFTIGLHREYECIEDDPTIPYYDETCLTEPPRLEPASWDEVRSITWVKFTNRDANYSLDARIGHNRATMEITGEPSPLVLERPWFTRPDLADIYCRGAAQIEGLPKHGGSIKVRKSKIGPARIGGVFKLNWDHYGLCWAQCRITEINESDPYRPEIEIRFELDRGYLIQQTYAPPDYVPPSIVPVSPEALAAATVIELPYMTEFRQQPMLGVLAARGSAKTSIYNVIWERAAGNEEKMTSRVFSYYGEVHSEFLYNDDGTISVDMKGADQALPDIINSNQALHDEWLMFAGDEIMVITTATLADAANHRYTLAVGRERFDTKRQNHSAGEGVFIIRRLDLVKGATFKTDEQSNDGDTASFKVQPVTFGVEQPVTELTSISVTFSDRSKRHFKPKNLTVNGTKWYEDPTFTTGSHFTFSWDAVNRAAPEPWENELPDTTYVELRLLDDTIKWTGTLAGDKEELVMYHSALVSVLGSEQSFKIRIYAKSGTTTLYESRTYDEATVTLI